MFRLSYLIALRIFMSLYLFRSSKAIGIRTLATRPGYFSRAPLNFELFQKRLSQYDDNSIPETQKPNVIEDCIISNRTIQALNSNRSNVPDFFGISIPVSNISLEQDLVAFLKKCNSFKYPKVIRRYLLQKPFPQDPSHIIELVKQSYVENQDISIVRLGIDTLLRQGDYVNSFKLLDQVFDVGYLNRKAKTLQKRMALYFGLFVSVSLLQATLMPLVSISYVLFANSIIALALAYGFLQIKYPQHLGRLSWRDSTTFKHTIFHSDELLLINRIINYFEENNEVNLKNYHVSQVRTFSANNQFDGYFIEPSTTDIVPSSEVFQQDHHILELQQMFRNELNKRKIAINDLPEELHFLEFWLTQEENFQWVEPDQDPAEMAHFRNSGINNRNTKSYE